MMGVYHDIPREYQVLHDYLDGSDSDKVTANGQFHNLLQDIAVLKSDLALWRGEYDRVLDALTQLTMQAANEAVETKRLGDWAACRECSPTQACARHRETAERYWANVRATSAP